MRVLTLFIGRRSAEKFRQIEESEHEVARAQEKSLEAIANAHETAHTLKQVLEANHISIQISKAIGNKNNATNLGSHR